jgi:hypothetical protein
MTIKKADRMSPTEKKQEAMKVLNLFEGYSVSQFQQILGTAMSLANSYGCIKTLKEEDIKE